MIILVNTFCFYEYCALYYLLCINYQEQSTYCNDLNEDSQRSYKLIFVEIESTISTNYKGFKMLQLK